MESTTGRRQTAATSGLLALVLSGAGLHDGLHNGPNSARGERVRATSEVIRVRPTLPSDATLRLLGVSDGRAAVVRDGGTLMTGQVSDPGRLSVVGRHDQDAYGPDDLTGDVLRWAQNVEYGRWLLHTVNLATGERSSRETEDVPLGWTPHGWLGLHGETLSEHRDEGTEQVLLKGIPEDALLGPEAVGDGERTLVSYSLRSPGEDEEFMVSRRTVLITDDGRTVEKLAEMADDGTGVGVLDMALTPHSEVWIGYGRTGPGTFAVTAHRRERAGGTVHDLGA
ncbi:hypothetical protein KIH74_06025 [Kineosporia sp. J2-2]|uniref:Lipoprotein n=1 Tax=Kineosporia corallincola TaxID=2835133 RepID=A0ABS5TCA1_9ACTN|nr:hypothetical protein [Kineosporia corallincola]MBT0768473.1 hypothetical protein [Kineosporia corallincola]